MSNGFHVKVSDKGNITWTTPSKNAGPIELAKVQKERQIDLNKLNVLLFSEKSPSVRRTARDIAGWPEIARYALGSSLSAAEYIEYGKEWLSFRTGYRLNLKGRNPKGALAKQLRFRQKSSIIRSATTVEHIMEFLENGYQVVISVEFMESIDKMREALEKKGVKTAEYTGRNEQTREQERLRFQTGLTHVMFVSVVEGISLHAGEMLPTGKKATLTPRVMLCHDIRYSSLSMLQIEGRTHRDGEQANIYYLYAHNTVEEKIIKVMIERMKGVISIMDDETLANDLDNILAA